MAHTTKVIEYKKLSNGQFSICVRCCDDPSTDHWHTMAAEVAADLAKRGDSITWARNYVQQQHKNAQVAEEALLGEVGKPVDHP